MEKLHLSRVSKFRDQFTAHFNTSDTPIVKHREKNVAGTTYFLDVHESGVVDCAAIDREGKTKTIAPEVVNYVFTEDEPVKTGVKIQVNNKQSYMLQSVYDGFFKTKSIEELYQYLQ